MLHYLLVKDRIKGLREAENQSYRAVVRKIGAVNLFRDRLNGSRLPARRIGRSRERQTKEFDQAVRKFESRVFENNERDSIRTESLPRINARKALENVIINNFNFNDEVVRGCRSRRNMPIVELIAKV